MRNRIRTSLLLALTAAAMLLVPSLGTSSPKPPPVAGKWGGKTKEDGDTYRTKIQIKRKLVKGRRGGTVNYPSFPCGGKLIFLKRKHNRYFFREKLTYGLDECYDGGLVRLKKSGRKLSFYWSDEDPVDPGIVSGRLNRKR